MKKSARLADSIEKGFPIATHEGDFMNSDKFRRLVLDMPRTVESAHMGHPDFRVGTKVFATLGYPDENWAMVKLKPEQQEILVSSEPEIFRPAKGAWGKRGSTQVLLERLDEKTAVSAIHMAWENLVS